MGLHKRKILSDGLFLEKNGQVWINQPFFESISIFFL